MFCKKYDVAVCGGGIAGCAAAIASAQRGMKTVLIENSVIPGGLATSGMVLVYLPLCDGEGRQVVSGLSERFLKISNKYGPAEIPAEWRKGGKGNRLQAYFSPASFVLALDEMLTEHGIDLWFDTKIIGAEKTDACRLSSIQVANKSGTGKIEAEVFVDATGDADAVHFAGGECLTARNALVSWFIEHREAGAYSQYSFGKDVSTIIVADGIRNNSTPEGIDGKTVSDFLLRGRRRYRELLEKDYEAGIETRKTRYPLVLPTMVPMRHSRCIKGRFVLDGGMEQARFPDSIGLAPDWRKCGYVWEIPYRSLLPEKITGVIAAGRCSSAREDAWEITRVIPNAAMTGEAAGVAAALSLLHGVLPHELNLQTLQKELRKNCGFPLHREDCGIPYENRIENTTGGKSS